MDDFDFQADDAVGAMPVAPEADFTPDDGVESDFQPEVTPAASAIQAAADRAAFKSDRPPLPSVVPPPAPPPPAWTQPTAPDFGAPKFQDVETTTAPLGSVSTGSARPLPAPVPFAVDIVSLQRSALENQAMAERTADPVEAHRYAETAFNYRRLVDEEQARRFGIANPQPAPEQSSPVGMSLADAPAIIAEYRKQQAENPVGLATQQEANFAAQQDEAVRLAAKGIGGIAAGVMGVGENITAKATGLDVPTEDRLSEMARTGLAEVYKPKNQVDPIVQHGVPLTTMVGGGHILGAGALPVIVGGQEYTAAREAGATPEQATTAAGINAAIATALGQLNKVPGLAPTHRNVIGDIGRSYARNAIQNVGLSVGSEVTANAVYDAKRPVGENFVYDLLMAIPFSAMEVHGIVKNTDRQALIDQMLAARRNAVVNKMAGYPAGALDLIKKWVNRPVEEINVDLERLGGKKKVVDGQAQEAPKIDEATRAEMQAAVEEAAARANEAEKQKKLPGETPREKPATVSEGPAAPSVFASGDGFRVEHEGVIYPAANEQPLTREEANHVVEIVNARKSTTAAQERPAPKSATDEAVSQKPATQEPPREVRPQDQEPEVAVELDEELPAPQAVDGGAQAPDSLPEVGAPTQPVASTPPVAPAQPQTPVGGAAPTDSPGIAAAVDKAIRNTWMRDYPEKPEYRNLSDDELRAVRAKHPKNMLEATEEQRAEAAAAYREQRRRYEEQKSASRAETAATIESARSAGKWPNGKQFPKLGDKVHRAVPGFGGTPAYVEGEVRGSPGKEYIVTTKHTAVIGGGGATGKRYKLSPEWTVEGDPYVEQQRAKREEQHQADAARRQKERDEEDRLIRENIEKNGELKPSDIKPGDVLQNVLTGDQHKVGYVDDRGDVYFRDEDNRDYFAGKLDIYKRASQTPTATQPAPAKESKPESDAVKNLRASRARLEAELQTLRDAARTGGQVKLSRVQKLREGIAKIDRRIAASESPKAARSQQPQKFTKKAIDDFLVGKMGQHVRTALDDINTALEAGASQEGSQYVPEQFGVMPDDLEAFPPAMRARLASYVDEDAATYIIDRFGHKKYQDALNDLAGGKRVGFDAFVDSVLKDKTGAVYDDQTRLHAQLRRLWESMSPEDRGAKRELVNPAGLPVGTKITVYGDEMTVEMQNGEKVLVDGITVSAEQVGEIPVDAGTIQTPAETGDERTGQTQPRGSDSGGQTAAGGEGRQERPALHFTQADAGRIAPASRQSVVSAFREVIGPEAKMKETPRGWLVTHPNGVTYPIEIADSLDVLPFTSDRGFIGWTNTLAASFGAQSAEPLEIVVGGNTYRIPATGGEIRRLPNNVLSALASRFKAPAAFIDNKKIVIGADKLPLSRDEAEEEVYHAAVALALDPESRAVLLDEFGGDEEIAFREGKKRLANGETSEALAILDNILSGRVWNPPADAGDFVPEEAPQAAPPTTVTAPEAARPPPAKKPFSQMTPAEKAALRSRAKSARAGAEKAVDSIKDKIAKLRGLSGDKLTLRKSDDELMADAAVDIMFDVLDTGVTDFAAAVKMLEDNGLDNIRTNAKLQRAVEHAWNTVAEAAEGIEPVSVGILLSMYPKEEKPTPATMPEQEPPRRILADSKEGLRIAANLAYRMGNAVFGEMAQAVRDTPAGKDAVTRLDSASASAKNLAGPINNALVKAYRRMTREDRRWLAANNKLGYPNLQRLLEATPGSAEIDAPNERIQSWRDVYRQMMNVTGGAAIAEGVERLDDKGNIVPFEKAKSGRFLRAPTTTLMEAANIGSGPVYEEFANSIVRDNPGVTMPEAKEFLQEWVGPESVRKVGSLEKFRKIKFVPANVRVKNATGNYEWVAVLHQDPVTSITTGSRRQAKRIYFIREFGQNISGYRTGTVTAVEKDAETGRFKFTLKDDKGRTSEFSTVMSPRNLVDKPTAIEPIEEPADIEAYWKEAGIQAGGQSRDDFNLSLVGKKVRAYDPGNTDVERLRAEHAKAGGSVPAFNAMLEVWNERPYGRIMPMLGIDPQNRYIKPAVGAAQAIDSLISMQQTSFSALPNLFQIAVQVPQYAGAINVLKAVAATLRSPHASAADVRGLGAMPAGIMDWTINDDQKVRDALRIASGAVSRFVTFTHWIAEFNNIVAGKAFMGLADEWRENGIPSGDIAKAEELRLTAAEIREIQEGRMSQDTYGKIVQNGVSITQYITEDPHRKSMFQHVPLLGTLFSYNNYLIGTTKSNARLISAAQKAWKAKSPKQAASVAKRLLLLLLGGVGIAGIGGLLLRRAAKGRDITPDDETWGDMAYSALKDVSLLGPAQRMIDAASYGGTGVEFMSNFMPKARYVADMIEPFLKLANDHDLGMTTGEALGKLLEAQKKQTPLVQGVSRNVTKATGGYVRPEITKDVGERMDVSRRLRDIERDAMKLPRDERLDFIKERLEAMPDDAQAQGFQYFRQRMWILGKD